jgi:tubulin gamma
MLYSYLYDHYTSIYYRLTQAKNIMVSANTRKGCYMSILNIIQGAVDPTQASAAIAF